jgi:hypothetical protein
MDIRAFGSLLFEIVVGRPANGERNIPEGVPKFVSDIIEAGFSAESGTFRSFGDIFESLKKNRFGIVAGVNSAEVSAFVDWISLLDQLSI